jgi:hypothetical protein
MGHQPVIADIDAQRTEQIQPRNGPSQSRPGEEPGNAGQQSEQVDDDHTGKDRQVHSQRRGRVEDSQPPQQAVDETGGPKHDPSGLRMRRCTSSTSARSDYQLNAITLLSAISRAALSLLAIT